MEIITKSPKFFILMITLVLFGFSAVVDISTIIIYSMSFLILMEVVRTIYEYIVNDSHRVKLRYVIDGAILFGIRELFVGWVMLKTDLLLGGFIMLASMITIGVLIFYRIKVIKYSPDYIERQEHCIKCPNNKEFDD